MKRKFTDHNGMRYEFRYLEAVNVIEVFKEEKITYLIRQRRKRLACNCPSGTFRGHCWHSEFALHIYAEPTILEPWTIWAEEAGVMEYNKVEHHRFIPI